MIAECEVLMLVSLQSYTLLHFKRKQLLRWNVCQLSEDRNIRNIPSVTKGETHTNRLSFRLNKHKVSYFCLLRFYFRTARALRERRAWVGVPAWAQSSSWGTAGLGEGDAAVQELLEWWHQSGTILQNQLQNHGITDSFRSEKPSVIKSNHSPSNAKSSHGF